MVVFVDLSFLSFQTGITVMHAAALGGNVDIVKLLLSYGVLLHTTTVVNNAHKLYPYTRLMCIPYINMEHSLFQWLLPQPCLHVHIRCMVYILLQLWDA